jgi:hypothetical protein
MRINVKLIKWVIAALFLVLVLLYTLCSAKVESFQPDVPETGFLMVKHLDYSDLRAMSRLLHSGVNYLAYERNTPLDTSIFVQTVKRVGTASVVTAKSLRLIYA